MQRQSWAMASILGTLLLGFSGAFAAQPSTKATGMTDAQVAAKLEAAGYTNVHAVEREGAHFDADATGKDGQPVHLHIDAKTGAVTPVANESEEEEKHEGTAHHQP